MAKTTCNLYDCFLCQHCMTEWRPLIGLNKETRMIKKGKTVFKRRRSGRRNLFYVPGLG